MTFGPSSVTTMVPLHAIASFAAIFREQVRASGLRLRLELGAAALIAGGMYVVSVIDDYVRGLSVDSIDFYPELMPAKILFPALGLVLPWALWRGEALFENAPLLSLPVERRRHLLIKVLAGWCWLLAATAVLLGALVAVTWSSGGDLGTDQARSVLTSSASGEPVVTPVRWSTQPWQWLVPMLAATVPYLLSSAFRIGVRHPWRWSVGFLVGGVVLASIGPNDGAVEQFLAFLLGEIGLSLLFGGAPPTAVVGGTAAWPYLPSFLVWLQAFLAWMLVASCLLWLATSRHRD